MTAHTAVRTARATVLVALLALTPGCELATHFGTFAQGGDGGGSDGGSSDGGGRDGGGRDGGTVGDSDVDASRDAGAPADTGADGGTPMHQVTVNVNGTGTGALTGMSGGASVGTCQTTTAGGTMQCTWSVADGAMLTLHGAPGTNDTLTSWSGACSTSTGADCAVTVTSNITLGATFDITRVMLTVVVSNPPGTVMSTAPAISCGGTGTTCSAQVDAGTMVTLTAAPSLPNTRTGWAGAPAGATCAGMACTFTITADTTITATFSDDRPVLSVTTTGTGNVMSMDGFIACNSGTGTCSHVYAAGSSVTLTAMPPTGSSVGVWTGCDSNPNPNTCVLTLAAMTMRNVTVSFTVNQYAVTVNLAPGGLGSVSSSDGMITCPGTCTASYPYNTMITLIASATAPNAFQSWAGVTGCGAASNCGVRVTSAINATANFVAQNVLTVVMPPSGAARGSSVTVGGTTCVGSPTATVSCPVTVPTGSAVTITTMPSHPWAIPTWSNGCVGNTCGVTVAADTSVTLTWAQSGNLMFVTANGSYTGALGGLAGANSICDGAGTAAGLPGPFIAFLSSSTQPMSARLPSGDTRWVRPDGELIAASQAQLLNGQLSSPILLDENGAVVATTNTASAWTGTFPGGSASANTCTDWTSTATSGTPGIPTTTATSSIAASFGGCTIQHHLYCMQTGGRVVSVPPPIPADAVYMFTSHMVGTGGIGIAAMDAACNNEAHAAALPGNYVALVSTSSVTALTRAVLYGTLTRPDGWIIGRHSSTSSVLTFGQMVNTAAVEAGRAWVPYTSTWNGMAGNASGSQQTCTNWTNSTSSVTGSIGDPTSVAQAGTLAGNWAWGGNSSGTCSTSYRWVCIQATP